MEKIILIQPKVGSWEFIQDVPMLPLALLYISSSLSNRYDIRIIDQRLDKEWTLTLKRELDSSVVCVGITAMTGHQLLYGLEASKIVKQNSNAPVVWGGIHPSILPAQTIQHPFVDFVVEGEGDVVFPELVNSLSDGGYNKTIPGVWAKKNGSSTSSAPKAIPDINMLPPIPYHLIRVEDYIGLDREGRKKFHVKTSRGCPYQCTFCHQTSNSRKKWRAFEAERVLNEMEMLKNKYNIRHFQILDDNFFVNIKRAHEILQGIADRKMDIVYTINGTRVTDILRIKEDTLKLLADTGCYELQIGLESGSQRVLDHMKKGIKLSQVFEANQRLSKYNVPRYYELVSGFRDETIDDLFQTAEVILKLSKDDPNVFFAPIECLTPYPGTEVYNQAMAAGMKFPEHLEEWSEYQWNNANLPWLTDKRKKLLESFHLFPTLISYENKTISSALFKTLLKIYRPWARFRVRKLYFGLLFETTLFNILAKMRS